MKKREFAFPSVNGKTELYGVEWLPEGAPRAVLQIAHGLGEHIGRYEGLAAYLTERGYVVVGNDHLGHGRSRGEGDAPLYFGPPGSWETVVRDIRALRLGMGREHGNVPCFLLGHSMGSFLARTYLIRYPGTVRGCVLMGTGQPNRAVTRAGLLLAERECRRLGENRPSPLIDRLAFGAYNTRFAPNRTEYDWLSANEENVDAFLASPLCGGSPTAGLMREMLRGIRLLSRPENLRRMNLYTPVFFLSGAEDPVGDAGRGVKRAAAAFRRAGARDVEVHLYRGLRHEILFERQAETVYSDLYLWAEARIPGKK